MLASPRRLSVPVLSCLVLVLTGILSGPAVAAPDYSSIAINEVRSEGTDTIELVNTGATAVDVSGLVLKDEKDVTPFSIPAGTTIAGHGYAVLDGFGFGLGKGDSARLFDGTTLLDSTTWPAETHADTWGRCPDGTGAFGVTTATFGAANQCAPAVDPATVVRINEIESNGDKVGDWVELTNTGATTVDVSGWKILDDDPGHAAAPVVVPAGTSIAPGGFYAVYTELDQSPGFGLGGADSATLLLPDGTTVVDTHAWTVHAGTTYGRCPDGTGEISTTTAPTRGASNACSPIRINEIESSDGDDPDWVELVNIGSSPVDISGWLVKDSSDNGSYTFPTGSSIGAHGYTTVDLGGELAGLGGADSVRLFTTGGATLVESYTWTAAAKVTYGRCKDGVGDFVDTQASTKGAANACAGLDTEPWPGSQDIRTADLAATFKQDLSGLAFDPLDPDVLWAAQNKLGTLFKLVRSGDSWMPDTSNDWGTGKTPTYLDGTGAPDTEGLTIGPDGFVYASSERNNAAEDVSRMSILRYDPATAGTTLVPTDEWNLTGKIPAAGANLGLEGVTWVPDSFLVANGFVDQQTKATYKPSDYSLHGTGLYVVAVEDTGALHAFALDSAGGTSHLVATIASGFPNLADVTFDPERQRLWAVTDDTHDGKTSLLKIQDGAFVVAEAYDRPAAMPNINNEGFAIAPQSTCVDGFKEVVWASDGDDGGHSIRSGTLSCTVPVPPVEPAEPTPADRTPPSLTIGGVTRGKLYVGTRPRARCEATDTGSGVASCQLSTRVSPTRTTVVATATDLAGNAVTTGITYRTLAYEVERATYRGKAFGVKRGKTYSVVGSVATSGRAHGPVPVGRVARPSQRLTNGVATVRIPRSAKIGSTWKILVKAGGRSYTIKLKVRR